MMGIERRCMGTLEVRMHEDESDGDVRSPRLTGYAALFGEPALIYGEYYEEIMPGAFAASLSGDVRALWNHDDALVLGRTTNGTLHLEEDERGLRFELFPPDTTWGRDALESIRRGDVSQMSFGFRVPDGGEEWGVRGGKPLRRLRRVDLLEISPVTFPAYEATSVEARADHTALEQARALRRAWVRERLNLLDNRLRIANYEGAV